MYKLAIKEGLDKKFKKLKKKDQGSRDKGQGKNTKVQGEYVSFMTLLKSLFLFVPFRTTIF